MRRFLINPLPSPSRAIPLDSKESAHALKVLRLKAGECVVALNGEGEAVKAALEVNGKQVSLKFLEEIKVTPAECGVYPYEIVSAVAKGSSFEWMIEKVVELGAAALRPLQTEHMVVDLSKKDPMVFLNRWQKIADQALKQCGRLEKLRIHPPTSLDELLSQPLEPQQLQLWLNESSSERSSEVKFLGQCLEENQGLKNIQVLVGPEGGWSNSEKEKIRLHLSENRKEVHCGPIIFRAETASVYAASICHSYFFRHK